MIPQKSLSLPADHQFVDLHLILHSVFKCTNKLKNIKLRSRTLCIHQRYGDIKQRNFALKADQSQRDGAWGAGGVLLGWNKSIRFQVVKCAF